MLKDAVDDTADTEGRLDNMRGELLFLSRGRVLRKADHLSSQGEFLFIGGDRDSVSFGNLCGESLLYLFLCLLEELNDVLLVLLELLSDDLLVQSCDS